MKNTAHTVGNDPKGFPAIVRRPPTEAEWVEIIRGDRRMDEFEDILDERLGRAPCTECGRLIASAECDCNDPACEFNNLCHGCLRRALGYGKWEHYR